MLEMPNRVLVVGLGRSGTAAVRLASADGAEVWVTDRRPETELEAVLDDLPPIGRCFGGGHPAASLDGVGLVVVSPGVARDTEVLQIARSRGIKVLPEVEFAWRHRPNATLAAVTGSNGKSTVTTMIAEMLVADGVAAVAGGNLGTAASDLVLAGGWDHWVLEISSFQGELLADFRPRAGVFLNLSQDHLERHADVGEYLAAKQRVLARQTGDDIAVLNADEDAVAATPTAARRRLFSLQRSDTDAVLAGDDLVIDGEVLISRNQLALSGLHNVANALASALVVLAVGGSRSAIAHALRVFDGLPHRHRTVFEGDGVRWVDDSKATNVGATLAALSGYPESSVLLILGGQSKGQDFTLLLEEVRRAVARVLVIGEDAEAIARQVEPRVAVDRCGTLDEAVRRARILADPGQTILLAPACASFDQFSGYAERGDVFAELAREGVRSCP